MILSHAELYRYSIRFGHPVTIGNATFHRREGALIQLTSPDGLEGWGEIAPLPGFSHENLDEAIDQLRTLRPALLDREWSSKYLVSDNSQFFMLDRPAPSLCFGLETAFSNLFACSGEKSLSHHFSDHPRSLVAVNGLISGSGNEALGYARFMKDVGYGTVKLKVGRRSVAEDVELVEAVAEVLGNDVTLRLDANRAWRFEEAMEFGGGVSGVGIEYVEEPLAEPEWLPRLAGVWGLPVALDESMVGMSPEALGQHAYARAVVLKPMLLGGISRALRFSREANELGMRAVVSSCYESGVGTGALVALAAAGAEPAGLDTYRVLAEDVVQAPLPLPAPTIDVRETVEAARKVSVDRLAPVPLL